MKQMHAMNSHEQSPQFHWQQLQVKIHSRSPQKIIPKQNSYHGHHILVMSIWQSNHQHLSNLPEQNEKKIQRQYMTQFHHYLFMLQDSEEPHVTFNGFWN